MGGQHYATGEQQVPFRCAQGSLSPAEAGSE